MIVTHKLEMDLAVREAMQRIDVIQGDANTRVLELTLHCGGEDWTVPEDAAVWIRYCKSDGTKGIYDTLPDGTAAWSAEGNVLRIVLAPQMLTAAGAVLAQAELVQGVSTLATFGLQIAVERNIAEGAIGSEDYLNMLQWMEGELDRLLLEAKESGDFTGPQGEQGIQGEPGLSVYDFAVMYGYGGTEAALAQQLLTPGLPLAGGTMTGEIAMGGKKITGLGTPAESSDAVNKTYVDQKRQVLTASLPAAGWTEEAPYAQTISVNGILASDWPRLEPVYTGDAVTDQALWEAFSCISYGLPMAQRISFYCLGERPEIDIPLRIEVLR